MKFTYREVTFLWEGGEYIDCMVGTDAIDCINVWSQGPEDKARISTRNEMVLECKDWYVQDFLPHRADYMQAVGR